MDKISPCLWFEGQALEAARFYVSLFADSEITRIHRGHMDTPGARTGEVLFVEFTLGARSFQALNGGPHAAFNDAISMSASCADQTEVDRLWEALIADGGRAVQCGWLKDKYGVSWQIVPERLLELMATTDADKGRRVMEAMVKMVKIDIAAIEAAAR